MIKRLGTAWWLRVANRHWLSTSRCRGFLSHGGTSKIIIHVIFGFFHSKPSILGYHHFRKPLKIFQDLVGLGFRSQWRWCGRLNLKVDAFSAITKGSYQPALPSSAHIGVSARVKMVEGFVAGWFRSESHRQSDAWFKDVLFKQYPNAAVVLSMYQQLPP